MINSQYLARKESGSSVDRNDKNASSHVKMPSSLVITNIAKSLRPCQENNQEMSIKYTIQQSGYKEV